MVAIHKCEPTETATSDAIAWFDERDHWFSVLDYRSASAVWLSAVDGESQGDIAASWGWSRQRFNRFLKSAIAQARQFGPAANAA
jgi:hypothetical protein